MTGVTSGVEVTLLSDIPSEGSGLGSSSSLHGGPAERLLRLSRRAGDGRASRQRGLRDRDRAPGQADRQAGPVHRRLRRPARLPLPARRGGRREGAAACRATSCASSPAACTCSSPARRARRTRSSPSRRGATGDRLEELDAIKQLAVELEPALEARDFDRLGKVLHENWELKRTARLGHQQPRHRGDVRARAGERRARG